MSASRQVLLESASTNHTALSPKLFTTVRVEPSTVPVMVQIEHTSAITLTVKVQDLSVPLPSLQAPTVLASAEQDSFGTSWLGHSGPTVENQPLMTETQLTRLERPMKVEVPTSPSVGCEFWEYPEKRPRGKRAKKDRRKLPFIAEAVNAWPEQSQNGAWVTGPAAAAQWTFEKVKAALDNGASLAARSRKGNTPLHKAAEHNQMESASLMLDHGAKINVCAEKEQRSPLTIACVRLNEPMVELMLQKGGSRIDLLAAIEQHRQWRRQGMCPLRSDLPFLAAPGQEEPVAKRIESTLVQAHVKQGQLMAFQERVPHLIQAAIALNHLGLNLDLSTQTTMIEPLLIALMHFVALPPQLGRGKHHDEQLIKSGE
jgi:hypothetical protein